MEQIDVSMAVKGTVRIVTESRTPMGPDKPRSGSKLHPLSITGLPGLELTETSWGLWDRQQCVAQGSMPASAAIHAVMTFAGDGSAELKIADAPVWKGSFPFAGGPAGLFAAPHSLARVNRFAVKGGSNPTSVVYLCTEALLGAAQNEAHWEYRNDASFRHGLGAVSKSGAVAAKWNFEGSSCVLFGPKGPGYGTVEVFVDGVSAGTVDYHATEGQPSQEVFRKEGLDNGFHALLLRPMEGYFPLDTLEAKF